MGLGRRKYLKTMTQSPQPWWNPENGSPVMSSKIFFQLLIQQYVSNAYSFTIYQVLSALGKREYTSKYGTVSTMFNSLDLWYPVPKPLVTCDD